MDIKRANPEEMLIALCETIAGCLQLSSRDMMTLLSSAVYWFDEEDRWSLVEHEPKSPSEPRASADRGRLLAPPASGSPGGPGS